MAQDNQTLDQLMGTASAALAQMDYLACEERCLEALALASNQKNWSYYARILLPLQEARRQRRLIAAEGVIRLGSEKLLGDPILWLRQANPGCLVLTGPHDQRIGRKLVQAIRRQRLYVEVLLAKTPAVRGKWTLMAIEGPNVSCQVAAAPNQWVDRWHEPRKYSDPVDGELSAYGPADWFLDASEALGNAALEQVKAPLGDPWRLRLLERCLQVVVDHEILHQELGCAARSLLKPKFLTASGG